MTRTRFRSVGFPVRCATLAIGLAVASLAQAQVLLNFSNVDVSQVAKAIGAATDTTIIVDPRVKGQVNLVSDNPVSRERALKSLEASLRMQGFAMVRDHGVLKVVPEADAKLQGGPTYVGNTPSASGDHVITQVFRLRNESASNLLPVLKPLISPNNAIGAYPNDNAIVVTDYADNVRRIAEIINGIDGGGAGRRVAVVPLDHESAVDLAPVVQKMLDPSATGNADATLKVSVSANPRLNAILLRATDPGRIADAKALIEQLDAPTRVPGNMHVVRLENANATELARVLRGMLGLATDSGSGSERSSLKGDGDLSSGASGSNGTGANAFNASSTGSAGTPPLPGTSSSSSSSGGASASFGGSGGDTGPGRGAGLLASAGGGADAANGAIQADPATNSLVITAPEPVYRNLRNVIDQLDVRREQVYLEAMIVELSATSAANLGVQWQGAIQSGNGNNALYGGTNFGTTTSQSIVDLTANGQNLGQSLSSAAATTLLNNGINIGLLHRFGKFFGLGALVQALATVSNASILSSPNLITLDNEEARIVVGSNVPVQTGSYSTAAVSNTGVSAFNTFDRKDVGIVLHVRPQITKGGVIKLQIYSEDSSVDSTSVNNPGGVTIIKRSVQSTVLSDDGEIVVLGGLIQDNYADGNNKVPWLGDLPLIGSLFRAENKTRAKTNVMVFLRPVILRDGETTASVSGMRYDALQRQMDGTSSDNRIERDHDVPALPQRMPGPAQGVPAAQGIFDLESLTRRKPAPAADAAADAAPGEASAPGDLHVTEPTPAAGSAPADDPTRVRP
ncbi:type II secretion system secretin GspD [Burkholderia sp. A1]|uniref:type II secretion system secretin GspD n=1 Tax=Burkholderia sp. A1 TaxID=148446 RepID=UPI00046A532E|nr:type II secretion system secretin GspD [Burkholderia sp. A1]